MSKHLLLIILVLAGLNCSSYGAFPIYKNEAISNSRQDHIEKHFYKLISRLQQKADGPRTKRYKRYRSSEGNESFLRNPDNRKYWGYTGAVLVVLGLLLQASVVGPYLLLPGFFCLSMWFMKTRPNYDEKRARERVNNHEYAGIASFVYVMAALLLTALGIWVSIATGSLLGFVILIAVPGCALMSLISGVYALVDGSPYKGLAIAGLSILAIATLIAFMLHPF